jgi:L-threonylcarbamoyladenylate synthase
VSDALEVARAADVIRAGGLVAFPTETVYGLGADASNTDALRRLYAVKARPHDHPVIVHIAHASKLDAMACDVPDVARVLADAFWPGPLTLVVPRRPEAVADAATGGRDTVGLRAPAHPVARALLEAFGGGIAAPSANRYGKVSPTTAAHVRDDLGDDVDMILDGGPCDIGVESTIVDVTGAQPVVLRIGGIADAQLAAIVGAPLAHATDGQVAASGTKASHYAPNARVDVVPREHVAAHVAQLEQQNLRPAVIDAPNDPATYAHVLYARLREADRPDVDVIVAPAPCDDGGIGAAVLDRLRRASTR